MVSVITNHRTILEEINNVYSTYLKLEIVNLSNRGAVAWNYTVKNIVKFSKYLGNFGTKTLDKFSKLVCIFRKIGHTISTNRITFTVKYFGPEDTKINCLNYKQT